MFVTPNGGLEIEWDTIELQENNKWLGRVVCVKYVDEAMTDS